MTAALWPPPITWPLPSFALSWAAALVSAAAWAWRCLGNFRSGGVDAWVDALFTWDVNKCKHPHTEPTALLTKAYNIHPWRNAMPESLVPTLLFSMTWVFTLSANRDDSVTPNLFHACPLIPSLFLFLVSSSSMSPLLTLPPHPCSSLNDNILVMVAFVFLGPGAWICQDAFPGRRLRGMLLRGNLGSLLRQLNPLTLCFLIKIILWLIRQKEVPPYPYPTRPLPSSSVCRQVWLQPVTDIPHCQAAKDVLADAETGQLVEPRGCRAAGERGTQKWREKEQKERWYGRASAEKDQVLKTI